MTRRRPKNVGASVRDRLLRRSRERGEDFQFLLERYAAERFLYRLGESAHRDRFVLKGAMLFALWHDSIYRPTRDLDFTGRGSSEAGDVLAAFREICSLAVADDGLRFDAGTLTATPIRDDAEYNGLRVHLQAGLSGARMRLQIDIGFGNAIVPPAAEDDYPVLLNDKPSPRVLAYPREAVVAEKLHAVVDLGERNSRYKDFYDLCVLAQHFPFDGRRLARAIAATFQRRNTVIEDSVPVALTPRFYADGARAEQWRAYLGSKALSDAPTHLGNAGELIQQFLLPPWRALADGSEFFGFWQPKGPWSSGTSIEVNNAQTNTRTAGLRQFKYYSAYRDSGIEWLGEIPAHWEIAPVYARYEVTLGKMLDAKRISGVFPGRYLRNIDVQWDSVNVDGLPEMDFAPRERDRCLLRIGDLLVCEGGEVGRTATWLGEIQECFYQKAIHRVRRRSDKDVPRYFYYLMYSFAKCGVFVAGGNPNTIDHLTAVQLKHYRFSFAPSAEQQAIVDFLDRETERIDALVAKNERLIAMLREKRASLIAQAVTKGLDEQVQTVPTRSPIFPEHPKGWRMLKLRWIIRQTKRAVAVEAETEYREIGIRSWGKGIFHKDPVRGALFGDKSLFYVELGDFVLNIVFAWEGAVGVVSKDEIGMVASHRFPTFLHSEEIVLDYLLMLMQSDQGRALMEINSPGAAGRNRTIRLGQFLEEEVPLPSLSEQYRIVHAFRLREKGLLALSAKVAEAIERLKELRIALITAAVTGKIDVREEVA